MNTLTLSKVKLALDPPIVTNEFDEQIEELISAGLADLGIAGVNGENVEITNPLIQQAVITYCKMNFHEPDNYERLKASYDEQKAQLSMASGYTVWNL